MREPMIQRREVQGQMPARTWHSLSVPAVLTDLNVSAASGLSEAEARERLQQDGPNRLKAEERETLWEEIWETVREPMIVLLLVTGVLYAIFGELLDTLTIFGVILFVIATEVINEMRAKRALSALNALAEPTTLVRRGGHASEITTEQVVKGDILLLSAGRRVPADARLLEAASLAVDESAFTGESVPVEKEPDIVQPAETPVAERRNLLFAGTLVTRGTGVAVVVATGRSTELGRIASVAEQARAPRTPLQIAMSQLSRLLVVVALLFSILLPLLAFFLTRLPLQQTVLTGLSLAFATIPEELPVIITLVLSLGAYRLARQQAIVKRLRVVEALGAVTVIATDKTGTLTQNRMRVECLVPELTAETLLERGVVCNEARSELGVTTADPMDLALLEAAEQHGLNVTRVRDAMPLSHIFPFDTARKRMSVILSEEGERSLVVKGAPEGVLACSSYRTSATGAVPFTMSERAERLQEVARLARKGMRVLAFAQRRLTDQEISPQAPVEALEEQLTFLGLIGFVDPPRPEVAPAIASCQQAGIRPILITGDHPLTAEALARQIGLQDTAPPAENERKTVLTGPDLDAMTDEQLDAAMRQISIYARTTPEQKLRLVVALQRQRERVAVTGDGINDPPALSTADIGIAMGASGTDVAREAADLILTDDNFASVMRAIIQGRALFANLQKGIRYYLAAKVALILVTLVPVLLGVPVPFAPVQIILMELFMDLAASAAFIAERAEPDLMRQPPRDPRIPFLNRAMIGSILSAVAGLWLAVTVIYLSFWWSGTGAQTAHTAAFVTWLVGHVLLAFMLRSEREPLLHLGFFTNRVMVWWGIATFLFVGLVTTLAPLHLLFKTTSLSLAQWGLVLAVSLLGTGWIEGGKWIRRWWRRGKGRTQEKNNSASRQMD